MNDLISRQAAIDAMTTMLFHYPIECLRNINKYEFAKGLAELGLKSVPSVQPKQQWILCSKRLPEKYSDVLCCDIYGEYIIGVPCEDEESNTRFSVENDDTYMIDCIAWMPLPKPYAERRTDDTD